jgi:hypothetical protein
MEPPQEVRPCIRCTAFFTVHTRWSDVASFVQATHSPGAGMTQTVKMLRMFGVLA